MKYFLSFILFIIAFSSATAQNYSDSLYRDYIHSYQQEKDSGIYFIDAFTDAGRQTFDLENMDMRLALKQLGKQDTAGVDMVTEKIVTRFINEQFLETECKRDYSSLSDLFNQYTAAQCNCVTEEMNAQPQLHTEEQLPGVMKECTKTIMQDDLLSAKWQQTVDSVGKQKFTDLIHYIVPYMYAHCPYLRGRIMAGNFSAALSAYQRYRNNENDTLTELISEKILHKDQVNELREYFPDAALFLKTKAYFKTVAIRVDTLKPMADEINWIDANKGAVDTLTCLYTGLKPEFLCQMVIKKGWQNLHPTVISVQFIPVKGIKDKQKYFNLFYDNLLRESEDLLQDQ